MRSLSRDEVRAVDRCAIETLGIPGILLMENAGRQVADAVVDLLGGAQGRAVAIVAGAGNNGGDGFVAARHLDLRGCRTVTFLLADGDKLTGDAAANYRIARDLGLEIRRTQGDDIARLAQELAAFDAVVDAIGGTGIRGPLRGDQAAAVQQVNAAGRPVLAVDIPTGLDCDTGQAPGPAIRAAITVTFICRKKGFDAPGAAAYTGRVRVADIGIPAETVLAIAAQGNRGGS